MSEFLEEAAEGWGNEKEEAKPRKPRLQSQVFKFTLAGWWYGYWNPDMLTHRGKQKLHGADTYWRLERRAYYERLVVIARFPIWIFTRFLWLVWGATQLLREICFRSHQ